MKRPLIVLSALIALSGTSLAAAQLGTTPDVRDIPPVVMLLIDTSGSMERRLDCICSTEACTECLPVCSGMDVPLNRWHTLLAALTGTNLGTPQGCTTRPRTRYDAGYFIPHFDFPYLSPISVDGPLDEGRNANGILDTYRERIKFGLMTFDTVG